MNETQDLKTDIAQALARGYCSKANENKVLDPALIEAMTAEVEKAVDYFMAMRLAAISTASVQNTAESAKQRIGRDNPYWTQAYGDVCIVVNREMELMVRCADYEEVLKDHNRLVRQIDVLMNGEAGAAPQASLCDLVPQIQKLVLAGGANPATPGLDWIQWGGGLMPVAAKTRVRVRFRDGREFGPEFAQDWVWRFTNDDDDIVAYKVESQ